MSKLNIVIADDHLLFAELLKNELNTLENFNVITTFQSGKKLIDAIKKGDIQIDIIIMDVRMPEMDGIATCDIISKNYPKIKILALSMADDECSIMRMFNAGARGYLTKGSAISEFVHAIEAIAHKGYYHTEEISNILQSSSIKKIATCDDELIPNNKHSEFLAYICSDLSYDEIANKMFLSYLTIDRYREILFKHYRVKTRVGLAVYAIVNKLVEKD